MSEFGVFGVRVGKTKSGGRITYYEALNGFECWCEYDSRDKLIRYKDSDGFEKCCEFNYKDSDGHPGKKSLNSKQKIRIYIAGPYTIGDNFLNAGKAIEIADKIYDYGAYPYVPHLMGFWQFKTRRPEKEWVDMDFAWLKVCDALFRMDGESKGSDKEVEFAKKHGIPVFYSLKKLFSWIDEYEF